MEPPDTSQDRQPDDETWMVLRRGSGPAPVGRSDLSAQDLELIRRFAPDYLLLAEGRPGDQPPHPDGSSDYHPRPVELFSDHATVAWIGATGQGSQRTTPLLVLAFGLSLVVILSLSIRLPAGPAEQMLVGYAAAVLLNPLNVLIVTATILATRHVVRIGATRAEGTDSIRAAVGASLPDGLRQRTMSVLGQSAGVNGASRAWETYCRMVAAADMAYPRTVYARIVRDRTGIVLQFWAFYYFNHFADMHESDWECVLLFFNDGTSAPNEPTEAAYSSHIGTIWRAWVDVPTRVSEDGAHPIVYVARGSHAQYFGPCRGGYDVHGALGALASYYPSPWNRVIRTAYSGATRGVPQEAMRGMRDEVPNVPPNEVAAAAAERIASYEVALMPANLDLIHPSADATLWKQFWWLRYAGSWDGSKLLLGPQRQHRRWESATSWARGNRQGVTRDGSSAHRQDVEGSVDCPEADLVPDDSVWPPRIEW